MHVAVTGGTGFIGRALCPALLERGHSVTVLTRNPSAARQSLPPSVDVREWQAERGARSTGLPGDVEAFVNLAGESIAAGRWTAASKRRIYGSRIQGTRALVDAIGQGEHRPSVLINASATGFYGDRGDELLTERSEPGVGFLARVVTDWEREAHRGEEHGVRVVLLRTGIVVGPGGGALPRMAMPFRFFAGGPVGSGSQWLSWVHLDDVVGLILLALENNTVHGPLNVVSPQPLQNADFSREIGQALHRPSWLPAPAFALRAILGEMADELLLASQRVIPEQAQKQGYDFRYPTADRALSDALR